MVRLRHLRVLRQGDRYELLPQLELHGVAPVHPGGDLRSTGSTIGYNLGATLIAGPGPLIAAALAGAGTGLPAAYIASVALICTLVLQRVLPETRRRDLGPGPDVRSDVPAPVPDGASTS
jgi:hypothetical protein